MKISWSSTVIYILLFVFSAKCDAQSFVAVSTGISRDINNGKISFYHIPLSLQWKPLRNIDSPIFFEFDYDIPLNGKSSGDAYTLNPSLPGKVTLLENIHAGIFTGSIGARIHIYTHKKSSSFYLNFLAGICNQDFKVRYDNYDRVNYEVLNPDVNRSATKFVLSMAGVYNFHGPKLDMFVMLHLQSPLLTGDYDYPVSYKFIAPLQLTLGYNLSYNTRK
jgi:hypothetical protein